MSMMFVGESWGREEAEKQRPFVGASGRILRGICRQVGIELNEHFVTNVFNLQPKPTNSITNLCGPKAQSIPWMPYLAKSKYVLAKYEPELIRLYDEIEKHAPNVIVALGATPAWALLKTSGIRHIRGAPAMATIRGKEYKVLPTYHPAAVMRQWTLRPIVIADLEKAKREATHADLRRPHREIWIEPTIADIKLFIRDYIIPSPDLSIDIETKLDQITCIGFAPTIDRALVIPIYDPTQADGNYWRTLEEELEVWRLIRYICGLNKNVVGQNFMYDMHFLWRGYGIPVPHMRNDTMLLHHALQPEMEKGLGFLGSVYTDEASWKFMRSKDTVKQGDD